MKKYSLSLLATLGLVALNCVMALSQVSSTAPMTGTITDPTGAVISGAKVLVKNAATGQELRGTSASNGTFTIPAVATGVYTVTIEAQGFKKTVVQDVKVDTATTATVNATMEIGAATESVVIQGGGEVLQTQSANISTTITGRQITDLPFTSRDALDLVLNLPGTTTPGRPRTSTINGLPKSAINITIDGVNVQDNLSKSTDGFFTYVRPRTDAIEEVSVSTATPGAESSAEGAVQIKFVTKGGTNEFHGGVYEYHRNPSLSANYWFNNRDLRPRPDPNRAGQFLDDPTTFRAARERILLNQFGGKLGGPILIPKLFNGRDKAFFFVNYEEYRIPEQFSRQRTILHPRSQSGFFRWVRTLPDGSRVIEERNLFQLATTLGATGTPDPVVNNLLAEIRKAAGTTGSVEIQEDPARVTNPNTQRYTFTNTGGQTRYFPTVRLDFNLNSKHHLENTWNYQLFTGLVDFLNNTDPAFPNFPNQGTQGSNRFTNSLALRSTLTNTVVNEARFGLQGGTVLFFPNVNAGMFANQGGYSFDLANTGNALTNATVSTRPSRRNAPVWSFADTLSWTRGAHNLTLGGTLTQINYWQNAQTLVRTVGFGVDSNDIADRLFTQNTAANFPGANATDIARARGLYSLLAGSVTSLSGFIALNEKDDNYSFLGPEVQRARMREFGFFAADSWRYRPNFTLNYGLRWEVQRPVIAQNNVFASAPLSSLYGVSGLGNLFKPGVTNSNPIAYFQQKEGALPYNTDYRNFAPSVGFAWSPKFKDGWLNKVFGDGGQTVLRGGYSIAYNREGISVLLAPLTGNPGLTVDAARSVALGNLAGSTALGPWPLLYRQNDRLGVPGNLLTKPDYNNLGNVASSVRAFEPDLKVPYVQSWSFGLQRELDKNTAIEVRYVGNRGSRFVSTYNLNEFNIVENGYLNEFKLAQANLLANQTAGRGATFAYFGPNTGTAPLPIHLAYIAGLNTAAATDARNYTTAGIGTTAAGFFSNFNWANNLSGVAPNPYNLAINFLDSDAGRRTNAGRAGLPANFFRTNPDRRGGAFVLGNGGRSYFDGLQLELRRRLSRGLLVQSSYAFSKTSETMRVSLRAPWAKVGNGLGITHAFKSNWIYELPFGKNKALFGNAGAVLDRFVGGWEFIGIARVQTGAPNALNGVRLVGMTLKELQQVTKLRLDDAGGIAYSFPQDIIDNTIKANNVDIRTASGYTTGPPTGRYIAPANNTGCIETLGSTGANGNNANAATGQCAAPRLLLFGPAFARYDLSIVKRTRIREKAEFEFRAEFLNAFNHVNFMLGSPNNDFTNITGFTSDAFSRVTQAYRDTSTTNDPGGRMIQFVARINF